MRWTRLNHPVCTACLLYERALVVGDHIGIEEASMPSFGHQKASSDKPEVLHVYRDKDMLVINFHHTTLFLHARSSVVIVCNFDCQKIGS